MILVVCMGRLGSLELAGGSLAIGFTNITGYSLLSGLATGMEPLCSQAFGSRNLSLASHTLRRTILMLLFASIPIGIMWINLQPLMVGNELGAGRPEKARLAAIVCIGAALLSSLLGLLGTTFGREAWGRLFIEDKDVLELAITVLPIIGICELANCPQTTSCGILRGSARPGIGAAINLYSFYLVGAPVAFLLAFVWNLGFVGLCYGLLAAQVACVVSILTVVYKTDWEREALKAKNMMMNSDTSEPYEEEQTSCLIKCEEGVGIPR
ncbi:Protein DETOXIFICATION 55 [Linum perenne]